MIEVFIVGVVPATCPLHRWLGTQDPTLFRTDLGTAPVLAQIWTEPDGGIEIRRGSGVTLHQPPKRLNGLVHHTGGKSHQLLDLGEDTALLLPTNHNFMLAIGFSPESPRVAELLTATNIVTWQNDLN